MGTLVRITAV